MNNRYSDDNYRKRIQRAKPPRTSDDMHENTLDIQQRYERERLRRNTNLRRRGDRELIDGRGSVDSRALNERNELVGYSIDKSDRHEPDIDSVSARSKWSSKGSNAVNDLRGSLTSSSDLHGIKPGINAIPASAKVLIVLIVILLVVLGFILFR